MRSTFGPVAWGIARMTAVICPGRFEGTICCVITEGLQTRTRQAPPAEVRARGKDGVEALSVELLEKVPR